MKVGSLLIVRILFEYIGALHHHYHYHHPIEMTIQYEMYGSETE